MSSSSLPPDAAYLADRDAQVHAPRVPVASMPVHVAAGRPVADDPLTGVQFGLPPAPLQLHHVPSSSSAAPSVDVNVAADAYNSSSSGSPTCGDVGCIGNGSCPLSLGVPLPAAPTRRMREFIPESKKDDEYWMKRQKNNEAAKRSREKRRANDAVMMRRIHELAVDNKRLRLEVEVLRRQLGISPTAGSAESKQVHVTGASHDAAASRLPAAEHQLSRHKQEQQPQPPPSLITRYDDTTASRGVPTTSSYHLSSVVDRGDQKRWPDDTYHHHHHHHHQQQQQQQHHPASSCSVPPLAAVWPSTCSVSVQFPTSSSDARTLASVPTYRYASSGNSLPSIGDLCGGGGAAQLDNGAGGPGPSSYRSPTDADLLSSSCRASSLPQTPVDSSAPIVIFSDVSSSGDESVDDSWFGRHVHTLTLRRSVREKVGARGMAESPLNLSTPSRHQSPRHAAAHAQCGADGSGLMLRRSSVDLVQVSAPRLPVKTASESSLQPVAGRHRVDTRRPSYESERPAAARAAEWLEASRNGLLDDECQSSRSTSQSSVTSAVAWQAGVDVTPLSQSAVDDLSTTSDVHLAAGDARHVSCGLPLKVRRKLGSGSTSRLVMDEAARGQYDSVTLAGARQLWSSDAGHAAPPASPGTQCPVSTELSSTERAQLGAMSNFATWHRPADRHQ